MPTSCHVACHRYYNLRHRRHQQHHECEQNVKCSFSQPPSPLFLFQRHPCARPKFRGNGTAARNVGGSGSCMPPPPPLPPVGHCVCEFRQLGTNTAAPTRATKNLKCDDGCCGCVGGGGLAIACMTAATTMRMAKRARRTAVGAAARAACCRLFAAVKHSTAAQQQR